MAITDGLKENQEIEKNEPKAADQPTPGEEGKPPAWGSQPGVKVEISVVPAASPIRQPILRGPSPLRLLAKLAEVMSDLNWVEKRGWNDFHKYEYATESDIMAAIRPRLAEKKVFVQTIIQKHERMSPGTVDANDKPIILCCVELLHIFHDAESGESMDVIGVGYSKEEKDDKAFYKAYTGAMKYTFGKMFLISSGDDPETPGTAEEKEAAKKSRREKQSENKIGPGQGGPQRSGDHAQTGENGNFTVTSPIERFDTREVSGNKTQTSFFIPNVGKASTIDKVLAEKLKREKGTGMLVKWTLSRKGSFINVVAADILPTGIAN